MTCLITHIDETLSVTEIVTDTSFLNVSSFPDSQIITDSLFELQWSSSTF